jgi:hypothetical protein
VRSDASPTTLPGMTDRIHITASARAARILCLMGAVVLLAYDTDDALAQRPFEVYDPLYQQETARRTFFDGYSLTTEVSWRSAGDTLQAGGLPSGAGVFGLPLGVGLLIDYQLLPQIDISAIIDAAGSSTGRNLVVSWVALKYYWTAENADYAFRLAVDPSLDGQVGFPQLDLAFLTTTLLSPLFSSDFALGARRIRMGYQQWITQDAAREIVFTRAIGYEVHAMLTYKLHLDPGGSNVSLTVLGEGGDYTLFESSQRSGTPVDTGDGERFEGGTASWSSDYRGGVVWVRGAVSYSRPSYMVAPYVGIPVAQWHPESDARTAATLQAGLRLMLR